MEEVKAAERSIRLSGVDLVDGTPVLDIKPYVPDYDRPRERHGTNSPTSMAEQGGMGGDNGVRVAVSVWFCVKLQAFLRVCRGGWGGERGKGRAGSGKGFVYLFYRCAIHTGMGKWFGSIRLCSLPSILTTIFFLLPAYTLIYFDFWLRFASILRRFRFSTCLMFFKVLYLPHYSIRISSICFDLLRFFAWIASIFIVPVSLF